MYAPLVIMLHDKTAPWPYVTPPYGDGSEGIYIEYDKVGTHSKQYTLASYIQTHMHTNNLNHEIRLSQQSTLTANWKFILNSFKFIQNSLRTHA